MFAILLAVIPQPPSSIQAAIERGRLFGIELAAVGDVDGDAACDLLVSDTLDPSVDGELLLEGRAWLVSGREGRALLTLRGDRAGDQFGITACGPGDLDGDGVPDLLVSAAGPISRTEAEVPGRRGYVRACSGADGRTLYTIPVPRDGRRYAWFSSGAGPSLCSLGDVDADGAADFAIGSARSAIVSDGSARVDEIRIVSGRQGRVLREISSPGMGLTFSIADCADFDGDGARDLLRGGGCRGSSGIVSSRTGELLAGLAYDVSAATFGATTGEIGDVDRDGVPELAFGLPFDPAIAAGIVVYSGTTRRPLYTCKRRGDESGESFGAEIVGLGDTNGDGTPDFATSCPLSFHAFDGPGVWIFCGADGDVLRGIRDNDGSHFGVSLANVGDLDGDGVADLAIGSASVRGWGPFPGFVAIHSGRTGLLLRKWTLDTVLGRG